MKGVAGEGEWLRKEGVEEGREAGRIVGWKGGVEEGVGGGRFTYIEGKNAECIMLLDISRSSKFMKCALRHSKQYVIDII